jgi:hypothetical protein
MTLSDFRRAHQAKYANTVDHVAVEEREGSGDYALITARNPELVLSA